jgi:hypothetical protein
VTQCRTGKEFNVFSTILKKLLGPKLACKSRTSVTRNTILVLEPLEDRWLPSTLTWHYRVGNSTNWTVANNWDVAPNQPATEYPGQNRFTDNAIFNSTSNATCTVTDSLQIANLTITNGYTNVISLNSVGGLFLSGGASSMAAGTLGGPGTLKIQNGATFTWTGGTITQTYTNDNYGNIIISGNADKTLAGGGTLLNGGTVTWQDSGNIVFQNGTTLQEGVGGPFTAKANAAMKGGAAAGTFKVAAGSFVCDPGSGTVDIQVSYVSVTGVTVNVNSGTLLIEQGSDINGNYTLAGGAQMTLASLGPLVDKLNGVTVTGTGWLSFLGGGGHVSVVANSSVVNVNDYGTLVDGTANLTVNGTYNWITSQWSGSGKTIIKAGAFLNLTNNGPGLDYQLGRTLDNSGTVTWGIGNISVSAGANIINENGATFDIRVDADIVNNGGGTYQNLAGAVTQKSAGNGTTNIKLPVLTPTAGTFKELTGGRIKYWNLLNNVGLIIVSGAGGGMDFLAGFQQGSGGSTSIQASGASMTVSGGNMVLAGGNVSLSATQASLTVTGQIQQQGGVMSIVASDQVTVSDQYLETGGNIELNNGGTITATNGLTISQGAVLEGYQGTTAVINAPLTNAGTINPGSSNGSPAIGSLTINGSYTQTSTGVINEYITYTSSVGYDVLNITGKATFGGTLNVNKLGTNNPPPGTTVQIINYGSRTPGSTFASVNFIGLSGNWIWWFNDSSSPFGVEIQEKAH